jgi:carbon-monoxide dehydrogenase medium subunit
VITSGFDYHSPGTVAEAIGLLTSLGDEAKILAGGHSLLPMMKLRLAEPAHLIDLANIHELRGIQSQGDVIRIGAMTTENELINSTLIREKLPLLAEAARQIADPQVRNRGTIGGDIAHADPANDQPAIAMASDATLVLQGARGIRRVAAVDFFYGPYMTVMQADELLVCLEISALPKGTGCAYRKLKRKTGDWATAGAAVVLQRSGDVITKARIGLTNVGPTPLRATAAEQLMVGKTLSPDLIHEVSLHVRKICQPQADLRGDVEYKTAMAGEMTKRAIGLAAARCS